LASSSRRPGRSRHCTSQADRTLRLRGVQGNDRLDILSDLLPLDAKVELHLLCNRRAPQAAASVVEVERAFVVLVANGDLRGHLGVHLEVRLDIDAELLDGLAR